MAAGASFYLLEVSYEGPARWRIRDKGLLLVYIRIHWVGRQDIMVEVLTYALSIFLGPSGPNCRLNVPLISVVCRIVLLGN